MGSGKLDGPGGDHRGGGIYGGRAGGDVFTGKVAIMRKRKEMRQAQMKDIAARAARLAVSKSEAADITVQGYYEEYLDQLSTGDTTCLRSWISWEVAEGCREAVEILKMWLRAELRVTV